MRDTHHTDTFQRTAASCLEFIALLTLSTASIDRLPFGRSLSPASFLHELVILFFSEVKVCYLRDLLVKHENSFEAAERMAVGAAAPYGVLISKGESQVSIGRPSRKRYILMLAA